MTPVKLTDFWDKPWDATVIWCRRAPNPGEAHQRRAAERLKAKWLELDTGHYPMLSMPDELTRHDDQRLNAGGPSMMPAEFDITGKVVFITGAGRGIGKGIAQVLAEAGADVALNALTPKYVERDGGGDRGGVRTARGSDRRRRHASRTRSAARSISCSARSGASTFW